MLRRASRTSPARYAASFQPPYASSTKIIAKPNELEVLAAGFAAGAPPITIAARAKTTRPVISTLSITFCSAFVCSVPMRFSSVRTATAPAAQIAELCSPSRQISEA